MKNNVFYMIIVAAMFLTVACKKEGRVTGVRLEHNEITLTVGESFDLNAIVIPNNANEKTVYWRSLNTDKVTVSRNGRITGIAPTNGTRIRVSTKEGNYEDFCMVIVTQPPVITITTQPAAITNVAEGSITGSLTVAASVTQGATFSYQWYSTNTNGNTEGTLIPGATSTSFTIPTMLTASGSPYFYFCEVRASGGANSVRSNVAIVNVSVIGTPVITITNQPAATTTVTVGSISGNLTVEATVTESATLSYQWYKNSSAVNTGGTAESGATSASFTIPTGLAAGTYYYFCEVKATGAETKRSNAATVTVNTEGTPATPVITITTQPAAITTVTVGSISGSLTVTATVTESATLSYQWYKNSSAVNTGGTVESGATSASFTIPTELTVGTHYYFCEVKATGGAVSVRSDVATVIVSTAAVPPVVTTNAVITFTTTTATLGGNITSIGTPAYTERGLCYSTTQNPTTANNKKVITGTGTGSFSTEVSDLTANTTYYVRAYVISAAGTTYGNEISFKTLHIGESEMVFVEGGTFTMGSMVFIGEFPMHQVTLSSFSIGKYEVTQAQWIAVMGNNPSYFKGDNLPVETVSWNDIVGTSGDYMELNGTRYYENGFIYKLNQLTGRSYRLPTESEWEYAAGGGNQSQGYEYSGSNDFRNVAWYALNSNSRTQLVGLQAYNELGIHDMSGNVHEWCSDWHGDYTGVAKTNPTGPTSGTNRVNRGGCWNGGSTLCRVVSRGGNTPNYSRNEIGFRLVHP